MDIFAHPSIDVSTMIATIIYAVIGILTMLTFLVIFDKIFSLDLRKELVEDHNTAFGILFAGVAIGVSIIISAAIVG